MNLLLAVLLLVPQARAFEEGADGKASLRYHGALPVLHVYGSPEEMGAQYGKLLKGPITRTIRDVGDTYVAALGGEAVRPKIAAEAKAVERRIDPRHVAEMKAAAREAGLPYETYLAFNVMFDAGHGGKRVAQCSTMGSTRGEPVLGRNFDLPPPFWGLSPVGIVVVRHPEKEHAHAVVTHPGFIGTHAGVNEKGLVVGATAGTPGRGYNPDGAPCMILFRKILEDCATAAEAEKLVQATRIDVATTLQVMDAKGGNFLAELSVPRTVLRRPKDGTLFATNHFISPELRESKSCERLAWLERNFAGRKGIDEAFMRQALAATAPGTNLQSMIFWPARRSLALATGSVPAARGAFTTLDAAILFPEVKR